MDDGAQRSIAIRPGDEGALHLVWVFATSLENRLDAATWLDTTRELRALGWRVTLIVMGPQARQEFRNIEVLCIPQRDYYLLGQSFFHIDVLRYILQHWTNDIDIILFHQNSGVWLIPLRLLRWLQGRKQPQIVMDTRDLQDFKAGNIKVILRNAFMRFNHLLANKFADGQTTITPRFVNLVNIPEKQLWGIWPSGVNPQPFADASTERQWPKEEEPIRLVYIGVMLEKRHPLQLCQAVNAALDRGQVFELYFYGGGPEVEKVRQCAAKSGDRIKVLPPISHEDIPHMLALMHIGVTSLPDINDTKYAASSPVKLFEYMASGLPLLATKNPCHSDIVGDGSFAFWVDEPSVTGILKGLEDIWTKRATLMDLGLEAQEMVDQWTWEAAASSLDEALRFGLGQPTAETH